MARMTGGEVLVQSLYREGIRVVFGLPGVQLYGVMAALRDEPRIRFITTRHEQATSYMADGYARAGGDVGTGLVVPGPGLLNSTAGLSTAYSASSPVLMLSGQIPREQIGKNVGLLHEVNDQQDCIAPITKWRRRVLQVAEIPAAVVVLVVGSRLALVTFAAGQRIVQIDVDREEIGRNHQNTVGLVGDARRTLEALLEKLRAAAAPRPSRKAEREALRAEIAALMTQEPQTSILRSLRSGCPEDTILIAGMTQIGYYSRPFWPTYSPRTYITS